MKAIHAHADDRVVLTRPDETLRRAEDGYLDDVVSEATRRHESSYVELWTAGDAVTFARCLILAQDRASWNAVY